MIPWWPREELGHAMVAMAARIGVSELELQPVSCEHGSVAATLSAAAPAVCASGTQPGRLAVILGGRGRTLRLLGPDLRVHRVHAADLARDVGAAAEASVAERVMPLIAALPGAPSTHTRTRAVLTAAAMRGRPVDGLCIARLPVHAPLSEHASSRRVRAPLARVAALYAVHQAAWVGSWWALGKGALAGAAEPGWLAAWVLLLATAACLRPAAGAAGWAIVVDVGAWMKQRLLAGALGADVDRVRREGVGHALGRVFEAESLETAAIGGAFSCLFAMIELLLAAVVLAGGVAPALHLALLVAWIGGVAACGQAYRVRRRRWAADRLELTHDLVERMLGHTTRLAQERSTVAHEDEDDQLVRYAHRSQEVDRVQIAVIAAPRGWVLAGIAALAPSVVAGAAPVTATAISLGGILLTFRALRELAGGLTSLVNAAVSWEYLEPIVRNVLAERAAVVGVAAAAPEPGRPLVSAMGIGYRHARRHTPILAGCDLTIAERDRVLLEGPSGQGKSTLAAILAGLRVPDSGVVLAGGLDLSTLGPEGWRRRVALAPQFHENHMFTGSLEFNLLMGRSWPPSEIDLQEAEELCRELGLGDVIARMPAGLAQLVGETGWQLSAGERSRVFLARALLQRAPVVILDESLDTLDPTTLELVLGCLARSDKAIVAIAHP